MKWFLILSFLYSLSVSAATQSELNLTVQIYNEKLKTVDGFVAFVSSHDKSKGEAIAAHMKSLKLEGSAKLPELIIVEDYLTFKDYKGPDFKMTPLNNGGMRIEFDGKETDYNVSMNLSDLDNAFIVTKKQKAIRESMVDLLFSDAEADDLAMTFRLLGSSPGFDMKSAVYSTVYAVEEMQIAVKSKYKNWQYKRLWDEADEACTDAQEGKKIKNSDKLIEKLRTTKKDIECVKHWSAEQTGSCAYYDQKIACISGASDTVNNNSRSAKPTSPADSSKIPATNGRIK